jgi:tetratricopeptide (TPR) repeat protein
MTRCYLWVEVGSPHLAGVPAGEVRIGLIGRARERAAIDEVLMTARQGWASAIAFRGEPGIGKSALLQHASAVANGFLRLETCGTEGEQPLAFAALDRLLRPVLSGLRDLPGVQADALRGALAIGPPAAPVDRFAAYVATLALLTCAAEQGPVLVVVDDLQWLDLESRECLLFMVRRCGADKIAVIFAERCLTSADSTLTKEPAIRAIDVGGLAGADATALVASVVAAGPPRPAVLARLVAATAGNPLALIETAARLGGRDDPLGEDVVASKLFGTYVASLDDAARQVLLLAAVSGTENVGTVVTPARAQDLPVAALDALVDRGLLVRSTTGLRFRHPLVRASAIGMASSVERREAHRILADGLTGSHDVDRRAWHLAEAAIGPDEEVAAALEESANRAHQRLAFGSAASALERAAGLSVSPQQGARRMLQAARSARLAGDLAGARRTARIASEGSSDPIICAHAEEIVGWMNLAIGTPEEARTNLRRAAALFEGSDRTRAAETYAGAAVAARVGGDALGAVQMASRARELCGSRPLGAAVLAYVTLGVAGLTGGDVNEPVEQLQEGIRRLASYRPAPDGAFVAVYAARSAWPFDLPGIRAVVAELAAELRASGALGSLPGALYALSYLEVRAGNLRRAGEQAEEAAILARTTGDALIERHATSCLALVAAHRGDAQRCRSFAAAAAALSPPTETVIQAEAFDALGLLELQLGNFDRAIQHLLNDELDDDRAVG